MISTPRLDLFGNPIEPERGRGRPRHIPTAAQRAQVRELRAAGAILPTIAAAIGITIPTLLVAYPEELRSKSKASAKRAARDRSKGTTDGSMEKRER